MLIPPTIWPFRPPPTVICKLVLHNSKGKGSGGRERAGGGGGEEVLCLPANTEQCVSIQLKFYFWLSHTFECMCDRFWAKWELDHFSIFLWFSDIVGLWGISRSHDMYRAQNWSQQLLKMHLNDCSTWVWCCIYQLPCTTSTSTSTQLPCYCSWNALKLLPRLPILGVEQKLRRTLRMHSVTGKLSGLIGGKCSTDYSPSTNSTNLVPAKTTLYEL